jgi:hypothetical protein
LPCSNWPSTFASCTLAAVVVMERIGAPPVPSRLRHTRSSFPAIRRCLHSAAWSSLDECFGAGSRPTPVNDTITLRDGHPCHLAGNPARYSIQPAFVSMLPSRFSTPRNRAECSDCRSPILLSDKVWAPCPADNADSRPSTRTNRASKRRIHNTSHGSGLTAAIETHITRLAMLALALIVPIHAYRQDDHQHHRPPSSGERMPSKPRQAALLPFRKGPVGHHLPRGTTRRVNTIGWAALLGTTAP